MSGDGWIIVLTLLAAAAVVFAGRRLTGISFEPPPRAGDDAPLAHRDIPRQTSGGVE